MLLNRPLVVSPPRIRGRLNPGALLLSVRQYPCQNILSAGFSRREVQNNAAQFLLRVRQLTAVQSKEHKHDMGAKALVPVHHRVIFDQTEA